MKLKKFKQIFAVMGCVLTLIVGLAITSVAQPTATAQANDKLTAEIEKAVREMYDAFVKRDEAGFHSRIAEGGSLYDKSGYIAAAQYKNEIAAFFKSPLPPNIKFSYELKNLKVVPVADETAVASYELAQIVDENGKIRTNREWHTNVLVRRGGRWQLFVEHSSDLPKPVEAVSAGMPTGWRRTPTGSGANYALLVDQTVKRSGKASANIKGLCADNDNDWVSLAQSITADEFRGKRLRLTGWLKTDQTDMAGLWMRVDGNRRTLGFDNMMRRPVTGTTDWKQYSVVLDVPAEAVNLYFGALVQGAGNIWADDFKIETVGADVALTNQMSVEEMKQDNGREGKPDANTKPSNLDFENGAIAGK